MGGANLASSDLEKTWNSACVAKTYPLSSNSTHSKRKLELYSNGNYVYAEIYYSAAGCSPVNYVFIQGQSGTWTLTGSELHFHISGSSGSYFQPMETSTTQFQTDLNRAMNGCGGTSPYAGGVSTSVNGQARTTFTMTCNGVTVPNSANDDIYNSAALSNGVLSLYQGEAGIPGFFTQGGSSGSVVDYY